jgi:hypothetical protein
MNIYKDQIEKLIQDLTVVQILFLDKNTDHNHDTKKSKEVDQLQGSIKILKDLIMDIK